jgi:flagellar biosynthetic protein FlhB
VSDEKTNAPTPRRLQKAREEGRVAVSRELSMLASLSAGTITVASQDNGAAVARWLANSLQVTGYQGGAVWISASHSLLHAILPAALAALGGYAAATLLQTGFLLHAAALQPDVSRISPLAGLKRMFGPQAATQVGKALAKLALLGACLALAMHRILPGLPASSFAGPQALYRQIFAQGWLLLLLLLGGQAVIAGADFTWERLRHARQLRMSHQEVRDEHKESEGNPQMKGRLRQLARARAGRRMMQSVPKAAVVITNPTHFAVALTYERGSQGAPKLVAKGADEMAARIRELARDHRVPIVANPPLARALYRVELDTEIPAEHFRAVAEIIAYVWRMRTQALRR